jgi:hypothetical protein
VNRTNTPKVLDFIPPPVPPEDAPINIKIIIIKRLGRPIIDISTLLKPVVLEDDIA